MCDVSYTASEKWRSITVVDDTRSSALVDPEHGSICRDGEKTQAAKNTPIQCDGTALRDTANNHGVRVKCELRVRLRWWKDAGALKLRVRLLDKESRAIHGRPLHRSTVEMGVAKE